MTIQTTVVKAKRSFVCLLFFASFCAVAQVPTRNQAVDALNHYVDYCNETIHALWRTHQDWRGLNESANAYLVYGPKGMSRFDNNDYLTRSEYYAMPPAEIYNKCLTASKVLGVATQRTLNGKLEALRQTLAQLQTLGNEAARYTQEKQYAQDPELRRLFALLERAEQAFDAYDAAKENLFTEVRKTYEERYLPANMQHRIVAAADAFSPALKICKTLLDDLDRQDTSRMEAQLRALSGLIARYEERENTALEGLYRFGANNGLDPGYRYERVVRSLKEMAEHGQTFGQIRWRPTAYSNRQKTDVFYNDRFLNKYNRYGLGLVQAYNAFIELADGKNTQRTAEIPDYYITKEKSIKLDVSVTKLLKWAEEPHQFRAVHPVPKNTSPVAASAPTTQPAAAAVGNRADVPAANPAPESLDGYADNHLVFLLDVSGSMDAPEKLPLLKDAFAYLLTLTRPQDKVAIVSYSGDARVELPSVSAAERKKIEARLNKLKSSGGTNANRGLGLAYEVASRDFIARGNNRIILASDGEFAISPATEALIAENLKKGVALTVFFFGQTKNERVLQQLQRLAALGQGNYRQITPENARQALLNEAQAVRR